jgi:hypothetical protein
VTDPDSPLTGPRLVQVGAKMMPIPDAERIVRRSATWFWWVAGLSLINSFAVATDMKVRMIIGLGITQLVDELFPARETIHLALVFALVALFLALGFFARRLSPVAYLAGMIVYAADAVIFLWAGDWISVGFHVFVLIMLWGGYSALRAVRQGSRDAPGPAP